MIPKVLGASRVNILSYFAKLIYFETKVVRYDSVIKNSLLPVSKQLCVLCSRVPLERVLSSFIIIQMSLTRIVHKKLHTNKVFILKVMIGGGAPLAPNVHDFIRTTLNVTLAQGYGLTEVTGGNLQIVVEFH